VKPLISIIIPSYNQGNFISETIDSILAQSYKNVEILVIDGGSNDETVDILKSYGNKIFWLSEKDKGQTHAINKGLKLAKGEIISYINSDDYYLENILQKIVQIYEDNKNSFWLTGDYIIIDEKGHKMHNYIRIYKSFFRKYLSFNLLSVLNPIVQPSTFLTKKIVDEVGLFDEKLLYTMDYDYWMRCIKIQNPIVITEKLSAFRIHKNSKGGSKFKLQFDEELDVSFKYQKKIVFKLLHFIHNLIIKFAYTLTK
jgi:glycosyltransferase involved in cell wall biosynthesis